MLWTIIRKQFLTSILTYKFVVGFLLCQVLFSLSAVILTRDYEERLAAYSEAAGRHDENLRKATVYGDLEVTLDRRPSPLSPLCEGFDKKVAPFESVSYTKIPTMSAGQAEKNPLMVALNGIDLAAIIQIVLSLLVLLFAYDVVSGEREQGTLALSLSNPVPRHTFLLGQYLGGMATILPVFLIGMAAALLIMTLSPAISLTSGEWLTVGAVATLSIVYLSALFLVGMLISTLTRRTATSLVSILFFWVFFVILLPHLSAYLAYGLKPIPPRSAVDQQARNLDAELWRKFTQYGQDHPAPPRRWEYIKGYSVYTGSVPYPISIIYAPKEMMLWELEGLKFCLRLHMEYAEKTHALYDDYERALAAQAGTGRALARLSPAWTFNHAVSILAGTDEGEFTRFLEQARRYRTELIRYAESKNGLFSAAYFTQSDISKLPTTAELDRIKAAGGEAALDAMIRDGIGRVRPLDLGDLPGWDSGDEAVARRITAALPEAGLLLFLNLVFFLAAHVAFLRADVRAG